MPLIEAKDKPHLTCKRCGTVLVLPASLNAVAWRELELDMTWYNEPPLAPASGLCAVRSGGAGVCERTMRSTAETAVECDSIP
jgi:hypothetical protein